MNRKILIFLKGFFISAILAGFVKFEELTISNEFRQPIAYDPDLHHPMTPNLLDCLILLIISLTLWAFLNYIPRDKKSDYVRPVLLTISVFCFIWSVPLLIIYWKFNPNDFLGAIKIGVFVSSTGVGIAYYVKNEEKFPSIADKVTFFSGVCLGPVGVIQILF